MKWYNSYQWWWSRIGGRPWTWIARDSYHETPLVWIIALLAAGALIGNYFGMLRFLVFLGIFLIGTIFGHFFWGEKWIKDQGEEGK